VPGGVLQCSQAALAPLLTCACLHTLQPGGQGGMKVMMGGHLGRGAQQQDFLCTDRKGFTRKGKACQK